MRISPPIAILSIIAASLAVTGIEEQHKVVTNSCSVLLAYLQAETRGLGSEFMIVDYPEQIPDSEVMNKILAEHPEFLKHPDIQIPIYRQMTELKKFRPTEKCQTLTAWLSSKQVQVNLVETKNALAGFDSTNVRKPIYLISMPGMSQNRKSAIIEYIVVSDKGGKFEVRLSRAPYGHWTYAKPFGGIH